MTEDEKIREIARIIEPNGLIDLPEEQLLKEGLSFRKKVALEKARAIAALPAGEREPGHLDYIPIVGAGVDALERREPVAVAFAAFDLYFMSTKTVPGKFMELYRALKDAVHAQQAPASGELRELIKRLRAYVITSHNPDGPPPIRTHPKIAEEAATAIETLFSVSSDGLDPRTIEACAKVAGEIDIQPNGGNWDDGYCRGRQDAEAAIRALSTSPASPADADVKKMREKDK